VGGGDGRGMGGGSRELKEKIEFKKKRDLASCLYARNKPIHIHTYRKKILKKKEIWLLDTPAHTSGNIVERFSFFCLTNTS
jgi:hypothetical protein